MRQLSRYLLLICTLQGLPLVITAQTIPPLERTLTISFQDEPVDVVLSEISQRGKFVFSYNPAIIAGRQTIQANFTNNSVREILNQIFAGSVLYKERGNYIILTKAPPPPEKVSVEKPLIVSGYVVNAETQDKLAEVSLYDKATLSATVTNSFGYFKIKIDKPSQENTITVSREHFLDTAITIPKGEDQFVTVALMPQPIIVLEPLRESDLLVDSITAQPVRSVEPVETVMQKKRRNSWINIRNIKDTLHREAQLSLVPFVGTNHILSGNVINDYSFNIIGGYSLGTEKLEFGGVFNTERGNVNGAQFAGVFNAVWGNVNGVQMAGSVNANHGSFEGWQFSGTVNANLSEVKGPQFAGVLNTNIGRSRGVQFAGVGNVQVGDYNGTQVAGVFNIAANKVHGAQLAGVMNFGRIVQGTQLGLVNIADSINGVPIGLISLVRKGYHKIELSADDIFYTNMAFRTGVRQLHNIFTGGIKWDGFAEPVWTFGYGFGTAPRLTRWLYLNFDLTSQHIVMKDHEFELNLLNKFNMGFDIALTKNFSIVLAATLNGYITDRNEAIPTLFTSYTPHFTHDEDFGSRSRLQMWWGGKVGLRFL